MAFTTTPPDFQTFSEIKIGSRLGSEGKVSQDPVFPICVEFPAKRPLRTAFSPQLAPAAEFLSEEGAGDKKTEWLLPPLLAARLDGRKGPQQGRRQKNGSPSCSSPAPSGKFPQSRQIDRQ